VQAIAMVVVALAPNVLVAATAMVAAGAAWISVANSLTVSAQLALPDWVRARGMSIYQMALMGSSAAGAALWGQVAAMTDVRSSLMGAAAMGCVALLLTRRVRLSAVAEEDLTPVNTLKPPVTALPLDPHDGPVLIAIEYRIDPVRAADFLHMMQERRSSCLRRGVLSWSLFRDTSDPARYVEQFVNESWAEHLRHFERMTVFDMELRERRLGFHVEQSPPKVSRYVAQGVGG